MGTNKKNGISLIVLVITIIVMIILAAAIILSLSNSGIIVKANKAKTDNDTANLKEYVNTLRAEYELMTADEKANDGSSTFEDYANKKLEEKNYKGVAVGTDGEVYSNLTESAKSAIKAGIKVGDIVKGYTIAAKTYETSGNENTALSGTPTKQKVTLKTDTQVTWKYIGIGEDGSLEIAPDVASITSASPKMNLSGKGGYLNGPAELDKACAALYSTDKGTAKSMNIDHVTRILGYTGEKGAYYDADYNYVPTTEAMTIEDIVSKKGEPKLTQTQTPNGKNTWEELKTYKSDYYYINKTSDVSEMKNAGNVGLVYGSTTYWLASPCVDANFHDDCADFKVRFVGSTDVYARDIFVSFGGLDSDSYVLRPVVSLNSNVTLTKDGEGVWNIK